MVSSFYSEDELQTLGLKRVGKNVQISRKASFYSVENITVGNNVRIDDFCILSGRIELEDYIHIAAYAALYGGDAGISMKSFSCVSSRTLVYAVNDDYSGAAMTNPTVPDEFRRVTEAPVIIGRHALIGSGSVILPGVEIGEGVSVGSMSLVNATLKEWGIYAGIPAAYKKPRAKDLLACERKLLERAVQNESGEL